MTKTDIKKQSQTFGAHCIRYPKGALHRHILQLINPFAAEAMHFKWMTQEQKHFSVIKEKLSWHIVRKKTCWNVSSM